MTVFNAVPGGAATVAIANGGKVYAFNALNTTPTLILPLNRGRQRIVFHNPGTVDILVAPTIQIVNGSNAALTPTTVARGGCFLVFANGGTLEITGECQVPWQAFSVSGSGNPLTVMDNNI